MPRGMQCQRPPKIGVLTQVHAVDLITSVSGNLDSLSTTLITSGPKVAHWLHKLISSTRGATLVQLEWSHGIYSLL